MNASLQVLDINGRVPFQSEFIIILHSPLTLRIDTQLEDRRQLKA